MSSSSLSLSSELRAQLQNFKVAELRALCKQHGIRGYSKAKHSELIEKLLGAADTTAVATTAPGVPACKNAHQIQEANHRNRQQLPLISEGLSTGDSSTQPSQILTSSSATPSTLMSDTLLITPSTLSTNLPLIHEKTFSRKDLPAIDIARQATDQCFLSQTQGASSSGIPSQSASKAAVEAFNALERRQAAVSLKDVVFKKREKKRAADPSSSELQESPNKKTPEACSSQNSASCVQFKSATLMTRQNPQFSKTFPTRKRDSKRAPVRFSVVPCLPQSVTASQTASQVPHLPLGTVPLAKTTKTAVKNKSIAMQKPRNQPVKNFVAPAFVKAVIHSAQSARNSLAEISPCLEEPLLSGRALTACSTSENLKSKQNAIERIQKSWLTRFYNQLAAARKDMVARNPNLASSRSPAGLPGMTAEFVHSSATGPEQLDIAVVFVIGRLYSQIGMDDWEAIVKEELVFSTTNAGGGLWEIVTRTQTREVSKRRGLPSPIKTELATYFVIGETGEVLTKGDEKSLRQDWRLYLAENSISAENTLMNAVRTKDDLAYPHGIAAIWAKSTSRQTDLADSHRLAEKYVLSNVMPNSYTGEYQTALQMEAAWMGQGSLAAQPRKPQVNLFLPEAHQVECVSFLTSGLCAKPLHPSIMIVKRKSTEDLALRETGQIIGNFEEAGVLTIWQTLIGCDPSGVALPELESKRLSERFWTTPDENNQIE
ncbi:hypothetical protein NliqN6_5873 [Naganishia liquefaciens]|uniref:Rho termination factor-like N-terminal domain-containing protein n=1 Tax=Naganishia liquefaciens TaxID=104408 RepID=A0A8H3YJF1_9TREE|nr:hypothetical protein NliqN6_5873 [Naganishia liquefaciens]